LPKPIFSPREKAVIELCAMGVIDKEIAQRLDLSLGTVRVYFKRARAKFNNLPRAATILAAWQAGAIDLRALAERVTGEPWATEAA
jgi:DNA-binding CsgD family transcriptional regulator